MIGMQTLHNSAYQILWRSVGYFGQLVILPLIAGGVLCVKWLLVMSSNLNPVVVITSALIRGVTYLAYAALTYHVC